TVVEKLKSSYQIYKSEVDKTVKDNERLPFCGGITCIHTPGHTYGHISYYCEKLSLLIAGDILQVQNGVLCPCPNFTVFDKAILAASLKKLSQYKIDKVLCYHGGLYEHNVSERIAQIAIQL
ncbi:MAG: MBL fold metallo-hydrolase, partial [Eubacteriaceae bacterium]|nr:MBL fold metallo-hydrolase [Eubacteriaceae bacterium]